MSNYVLRYLSIPYYVLLHLSMSYFSLSYLNLLSNWKCPQFLKIFKKWGGGYHEPTVGPIYPLVADKNGEPQNCYLIFSP